MTTIVVNLATNAVTEYDWTFPTLTASRVGSDAGLFTLGGDSDNGAAIDAVFDSGVTLRENLAKTGIESVYLELEAVAGTRGMLRVSTPDEPGPYEYEVIARGDGVSRAKPGRGIRENLLGIGYRNLDGSDFAIDGIEVRTTPSKQRKI